MRVKIGNAIYDSLNTPIMIIFDEGESDQIGRMGEGDSKYCSYPNEGFSVDDIEKFMKFEEGE